MTGHEVRSLREWLRIHRGVRWSERKCAGVLATVETELARHRVVSLRETLRQGELDEAPATDAEMTAAFADLRKQLAGGAA